MRRRSVGVIGCRRRTAGGIVRISRSGAVASVMRGGRSGRGRGRRAGGGSGPTGALCHGVSGVSPTCVMRPRRTQSTGNLVGLARDEEIDAVVLARQLGVQVIFEAAERGVLVAGDGDGRGLVARGVNFDVVLERVVVNVICTRAMRSADARRRRQECNASPRRFLGMPDAGRCRGFGGTYGGSIAAPTPSQTARRISCLSRANCL